MPTMHSASPTTAESSDDVGLIIALLTRFPQIATIVAHPRELTIELTFAVRGKLEAALERSLRDEIVDHVAALVAIAHDETHTLEVACDRDPRMSFLRVRRDAQSFTREELVVMTALVEDRLGTALVRSPEAPETGDEDIAAQDELVDVAIEALRDPSRQKSLVGVREERGVLVYFLTSRSKKKLSRARR